LIDPTIAGMKQAALCVFFEKTLFLTNQHNTKEERTTEHTDMSTAGRATYQAAKGTAKSSTINTSRTSGRDQTAHTKLKYRQVGQNAKQELQNKNLKSDLEEREIKYLLSDNKETKWMVKEEEKKVDVQSILAEKPQINFETIKQKYDDADIDVDYDEQSDDENKKRNGNESGSDKSESDGFDTSR
jgi:hypothetical protein